MAGMTKLIAATIVMLLFPIPALAAGLVTPSLSAPLPAVHIFDPEPLLTTGGLKYSAASDLTLEPELGVGYRAVERDVPGGAQESIHRVHAQAGGRVSLADTLYLSAAAKLPVYSYQSTGSLWGQALGSRQGYDLVRSLKGAPNWTGELGVRLSSFADLTLYYDKSLMPGSLPGMTGQEEQRLGTRLIWRFK